jgi:beta-glucosidase-like glycosyl hydrolase
MWRVAACGALAASAILVQAAAQAPPALDRDAERWVAATLRSLTPEQRIGQLLVPRVESVYTSTESDEFDRLARLVRDASVGGFLVMGGRQPSPGALLLNAGAGTVTLGQPLSAASLLNRLQGLSRIPLLNAGDFEAGVGFRMTGATLFPRAMAFGAAGDDRLAHEAGRITAREARAIGVQVNFAPVVDVNNNPRNPVINTRSFGEDPALVSRLAAAYIRGLESEGVIATVKHFPGHGDTDIDTHLGLATLPHDRERLERVEWVPFRAGVAAGASGLMTAHLELPALDATPATPSTFSRPVVDGFVRGDLGFRGLIYTDSMTMQAVTKMATPGEAAVRAIKAGNDVVLDSPDPLAAFDGIRAAVASGEIEQSRIDRSAERVLGAKARLGLHKNRSVSLDALPGIVGSRAHQALAQEVSERSITLVKDDRDQVPLRLSAGAPILCLSVLDYPSGWGIGAPGRTFVPEMRRRWSDITAIELSDRTSPSELELVRATLNRYDAIVAAVFVRTASFSGRMDLNSPLVSLLQQVARATASSGKPFVAVLFGNPYTATFFTELPAMLVTYDFYDRAELAAVRALAGEVPIGGRLPIVLPGVAALGHGLERMPLEAMSR